MLNLVDRAMLEAMLPGVVGRLLPAVILNAGSAATALAEGMVSWSGAVAGALICIAIYLGAGWQGWIMLVATFVIAAVTSNVGWQRKVALAVGVALPLDALQP